MIEVKKIAMVLIVIGVLMIMLGISILIKDMLKDNYCSSLEPREYIQNREYCKDIIEE